MPEPMPGRASILNSQRSPSRNGPSRCSSCGTPRSSRAQWIAPLRRWYGIWFAIIGISDATTAAITTDFAGGVFGRLAGHTFLLAGLLIITLAVPLLATANTPAQRKLGKYWKKLQR